MLMEPILGETIEKSYTVDAGFRLKTRTCWLLDEKEGIWKESSEEKKCARKRRKEIKQLLIIYELIYGFHNTGGRPDGNDCLGGF